MSTAPHAGLQAEAGADALVAADAAAPSPIVLADLDVDAAVENLADLLAQTAVERDRVGGHAGAQRDAVRASGLLALTVPRRHGGLERGWDELFGIVRRLARVDSAIAHLFAFHHLQVASILIYGSVEQQRRLLTRTIDEGLFWGNALNPLDRSLIARPVDGGWELNGTKRFTSGSLGSDLLTLTAHVESRDGAAPVLLIAAIETGAPGITVNEDWDGFGQRQTDSGSVRFERVYLAARDVLQAPGQSPTPFVSLRTQVSQAMMANLYLGIAEGAFEAARGYTARHARPAPASGLDRAADDPYVQHRYGQLWLLIRPAQLAADAAGATFQQAYRQGPGLTLRERAEVAVAVAEAKVLAHRAAVEVSSQFFELTGSSSTSSRLGLDRFWRNARVHTLHDPVDYKLRDIGRYRLDGRAPDLTPYS